MNTSTVSQAGVSPVPTVVPQNKVKPVASDEQVDDFCNMILLGLPTGKILPASITELKECGGITAAQLASIKAARKEHEANADADRKVLFKLARSRRVRGARFNKEGKLAGMRFGDKLPKAATV